MTELKRIQMAQNQKKTKHTKPHLWEVFITKYVMLMLPNKEGYTVFVRMY